MEILTAKKTSKETLFMHLYLLKKNANSIIPGSPTSWHAIVVKFGKVIIYI